jgi:hypothetical protein
MFSSECTNKLFAITAKTALIEPGPIENIILNTVKHHRPSMV